MRHSSVNPHVVNPEYISARDLHEAARHYLRYYLVWFSDSEIVQIEPRVYARGTPSLYRITLASGESTVIAWSSRITIYRKTVVR